MSDAMDDEVKRKETGETAVPQWLLWAREIEAIGQIGCTFAKDTFDQIRYKRLITLASEIMSTYNTLPEKDFAEVFLKQEGYATPKVDVRGAIIKDGKILLVQERSDGNWSLPGGFADINEKPSAMIEREVWEESGFVVKARRLIGVYESNHDRVPLTFFHAYKLVFRCELIAGQATISNETSAVEFFNPNQLPPLSLTRVTPRIIEEVFKQEAEEHPLAFFD